MPRLFVVNDADIERLMSWFGDAAAVKLWSGPQFRYPFTKETFREDCKLSQFANYALKDDQGSLLGFGQIGERYERSHFARLVVNPLFRGQGCGRQLLQALVRQSALRDDCEECGLFVYRHNTAAKECYLAAGFEVVKYPDNAPMADECFYMTRRSA